MTRRGRFLWVLQAISGMLLILLAGLHWIAQHYIARGGLRDYTAVIAYLQNPLSFGLEVTFLLVVTAHALLGVRAILMDLGPGKNVARALNFTLLVIGIATIWYGIDLMWDILW
jgi:succinate dehydrogenase hydrophobic anchor subunit